MLDSESYEPSYEHGGLSPMQEGVRGRLASVLNLKWKRIVSITTHRLGFQPRASSSKGSGLGNV